MRKRYRGLSYGTPLALSDDMIMAVLDNQKTLTVRALSEKERSSDIRVINGWPCSWSDTRKEWIKLSGPYGEVGDYLWVRESYRLRKGSTEYRLLVDPNRKTPNSDWLPVVGMPEECSRICLKLTGYKYIGGVQSLKAMDLYHDGFSSVYEGKKGKEDIRTQFMKYWDTRYRDVVDKWSSNPPIWVTEFRLLTEEESNAMKKAKDFLK